MRHAIASPHPACLRRSSMCSHACLGKCQLSITQINSQSPACSQQHFSAATPQAIVSAGPQSSGSLARKYLFSRHCIPGHSCACAAHAASSILKSNSPAWQNTFCRGTASVHPWPLIHLPQSHVLSSTARHAPVVVEYPRYPISSISNILDIRYPRYPISSISNILNIQYPRSIFLSLQQQPTCRGS